VIDFAAERLLAEFAASGLSEILGPEVLLVPAPRSSMLVYGGLWPAHRIATALATQGLGSGVWTGLKRIEPVAKSAGSQNRPKAADHYRTMVAEPPLDLEPRRVAVVDDVVTRGATLLAGVSRVQDIFPEARVTGFGLIRTMSDAQVERIAEPVTGLIQLHNSESFRTP
jgi:hypoxanthine phosphoribosyltransferase